MRSLDDLLRETPVKTIAGFRNAAYDPKTDTIYIDPRFVQDKTILAHEIGHKLTGNAITELAPILGRKGEWIPILGTLGAVGLGEIFPDYRRQIALANMGIQAAAIAPQLYSEYAASQKAKELYPQADNGRLSRMYDTYLGNAALRLGTPAAIHILHEILKGVPSYEKAGNM